MVEGREVEDIVGSVLAPSLHHTLKVDSSCGRTGGLRTKF
jgi:hypothetical protein